jgi:predicted RND superfamily exporter protein
MALLGVPFNAVTGTITSLTVGLGVAYNIHMAERYLLERRHGNDPREALRRSVRGTGGALLGSAATTVGGFGVLAFAILPPLQQFGLVTGLTIVYAFVGSVFVLPSLLVLWTRYARPDVVPAVDRSAEGEGETTATDGGWEYPR